MQTVVAILPQRQTIAPIAQFLARRAPEVGVNDPPYRLSLTRWPSAWML
jgi:hypothetical protein